MVYVDSSVFLAGLFAEDRAPTDHFWAQGLFSSRLLEYEVWTVIHMKKAADAYEETARAILGQVELLDLAPSVLARALEPFPAPVRTLDAIHLASAHFLRARGLPTALATYDRRLARAARAMGFEIIEP